jgi:hypothetical protein
MLVCERALPHFLLPYTQYVCIQKERKKYNNFFNIVVSHVKKNTSESSSFDVDEKNDST